MKLIMVVILSFIFQGQAISKVIFGVVLDSKTMMPIPFAHVLIDEMHEGTVTNLEGKFKVKISQSRREYRLVISSIGYESSTVSYINANEGRALRVLLKESFINLPSFVLTPDTLARFLVKKSIQEIPNNYPNRDEILRGFVREMVYPESNKSSPYYVAEAVVKATKKSYGKINRKGQVQLLQGRKYESEQIDSVGPRFYGGLHDIHANDYVMSRLGPLDRKLIDAFDFDLVDTTSYNGKAVFEVSFRLNTPDNETGFQEYGRILISNESYAIVRIEVNYRNSITKSATIKKRLEERYTVSYQQNIHDNLWRLKDSNFIMVFQEFNTTQIKEVSGVMVVTGYEPLTEIIPYQDRLGYKDVFVLNTGTTDSSFWKDYTTFAGSEIIDSLMLLPHKVEEPSKPKTQREKVKLLLRGFQFGYDVSLLTTNFRTSTINHINTPFVVSEILAESIEQNLTINTNFSYKINPRVLVGYEGAGSINQNRFSAHWLNVMFETNLKRKPKRPLYIQYGLKFGFQQFGKPLKSILLTETSVLNNKKYDSEEVLVFYEVRSANVGGKLTIAYELNKRLRVNLVADYTASIISHNEGLYFKEKQSFLKRKSSFIGSGNSDLTISSDQRSFSQSMSLGLGISIHY